MSSPQSKTKQNSNTEDAILMISFRLFPSRQIQEQYHVYLERYKNDVFESEGDFPSQARWVPLLNMNQKLLSSKILHEDKWT